MGTIERKKRERLEMRKTILAATTEMVLKAGFEKTSIRSIAEKIEFSVGTIYIYFRDKNELLNALMEQGFEKLSMHFGKTKPDEDPVIRLKHLASNYIKFGLTNPEYYDLMFIMKKPIEFENNETYLSGSKAFGILYQCVQECLEKKKIRLHGAESAALTIWSFVHGLISLQIMNRLKIFDQKNIERDIYASVENFIHAILIN